MTVQSGRSPQRRTKRPGRTFDPRMVDSIRDMCGFDPRPSSAAIRKALKADPRFKKLPDSQIPSEGTIADICEAAPPRGERWSLLDATPDEARHVLPVIAAVIETTHGRRTYVTKDEARVIARIYAAAPDVPPAEAFRVTRELLWAAGDPVYEAMQTHWLAFRAWTPEGQERYRTAPLPTRYEVPGDMLGRPTEEGDQR